MKITADNSKVRLSLPRGFERLTNQEIRENGATPSNDLLVFHDSKKQMFYQVGWVSLPVIGKLTSLRKMVNKHLKQHREKVTGFRNEAFLFGTISGLEAEGFRYEYTENHEDHVTDYLLVKHNKKFYGFSSSYRKENADICHDTFENMLECVVF